MLRNLGCDVSSFPNEWKGLKNGQLLRRMEEAGFTVLLTCDKNLPFQQNIERSKVGLVVLPSQFFGDLVPIASEIAQVLGTAKVGGVSVVRLATGGI
jgi:hypothetical protein